MISGWAHIKVQGNAGDRIKLRFVGEEKNDFGQVDLLLRCGAGGVEQWEPRFTWHTFRYIEVISRQVRMNKESLVAKVVHTDPQLPEVSVVRTNCLIRSTKSTCGRRRITFTAVSAVIARTGNGWLILETRRWSWKVLSYLRYDAVLPEMV